MPTEVRTPIPLGSRVLLIEWDVPGIKIAEGCFKADEHHTSFHNGGGRGQMGYFWFASDSKMRLLEKPLRKKTGFAKFIERTK